MANITAPNGTIHSINAERGKSHCGRIVVGSEGTKKSRKDTTCGRCDQLNPALKDAVLDSRDGAATAVKTNTPASKRAGAVKAAATPVKGVRKTAASKAATKKVIGTTATITQDDDVADLYTAFTFLLDANKVLGNFALMEMGTALSFDNDGFSYLVWHPRYNSAGVDEWRIQWAEDFGTENGVTEDFATMEEALAWLIEDTGFKAAKVPPASVRKPARKPVAAVNGSDGTHLKGATAGHVRNALTSLGKLPEGSLSKDQARLVAASVEALSSLV